MSFHEKYLKYKSKYLSLMGGAAAAGIDDDDDYRPDLEIDDIMKDILNDPRVMEKKKSLFPHCDMDYFLRFPIILKLQRTRNKEYIKKTVLYMLQKQHNQPLIDAFEMKIAELKAVKRDREQRQGNIIGPNIINFGRDARYYNLNLEEIIKNLTEQSNKLNMELAELNYKFFSD